MLSKSYESIDVNHRTWLHMPFGCHSDTHQGVKYKNESIHHLSWIDIKYESYAYFGY